MRRCSRGTYNLESARNKKGEKLNFRKKERKQVNKGHLLSKEHRWMHKLGHKKESK